jgi:hypothetical protein
VPALVFNTTEVYTGYRRLVSPFTIPSDDPYLRFLPIWPDSQVGTFDPDASLTQMPLSTAAFLSARFPWITPAGRFTDVGENSAHQIALEKIRVVDGGYFENSGVVTAMDVVEDIANALNDDSELAQYRDRIEINLITLNSKEYSANDFYGLSEILAPVDTMLSTRIARGPIETARAQQLLTAETAIKNATQAIDHTVSERFIRLDLNWLGYPLPLGWRLSPLTQLIIDSQLGFRQACEITDSDELNKVVSPSVDCLRKLLFQQLVGG